MSDPEIIKEQVKKPKRKLKLKLAPISSICSILLGGVIALISTFSFIVNILTTLNPIALLIDIFVMTLSYMTVWQGIYYSIQERIAKERMEEQWEFRMQPILNLITETSGRIDSIETEMSRTNHKLDSTLDYFMRSQDIDTTRAFILPGVSFKFISKILVLIVFTSSALVYASSYPLGIIHYFILAIYLTWWVFITAEFKLFGNSIAWTWAIAPTLIIPSVGIIMSAIYGINVLIGIMFFALLFYVYFYYSWASFVATGYKMIDLKPVILEIKDRIEKNKQQAEFKKTMKEKTTATGTRKPVVSMPHIDLKINFKLNLYKIGILMVIGSIVLLASAGFGLSIQNGLMPNVTWRTLGLGQFVWKSLYSYVLTLLGMILLGVGYSLVLKFRKKNLLQSIIGDKLKDIKK
ncbi:MAG: hypothetical protein O8C64_12580 [Candidatus Methanoperedens sp.]|nr:hypothetical protein [Candidatus Methanoperedens sp.]